MRGSDGCDLGGPHTYDRGDAGTTIDSIFAQPEPLTALSHNMLNEADDRPAYRVLCKFINAGWRSLRMADHPLPLYEVPADSFPPTFQDLWPAWEPRYPFSGGPFMGPPDRSPVWQDDDDFATENAEAAGGPVGQSRWPSKSGSPWAWNARMPAIFEAGGHPWKYRRAMEIQPWLRVRRNWFILLQDPELVDPHDPPQVDDGTRVGATLAQAQAVGLAIRILVDSLPTLRSWANREAERPNSDLSQAGYTNWGVRPDKENHPDRWLFNEIRDWADGEREEPIHVVIDPKGSGGGHTYGGNVILLNQGVVSRVGLSGLIDLARLHWARRYLGEGTVYSYSDTDFQVHEYDWITPSRLRLVARRLGTLAALIAHELMHLVWRRDFDYQGAADAGWIAAHISNPHNHGHGWGDMCCGPALSVNALVPYSFTHDSQYEPTLQVGKHWVTHLYQEFVEGLLQHDLSGALASKEAGWHRPSSDPNGPGDCLNVSFPSCAQ